MGGLVDGVPQEDTQYGYIPTLWVCALFIALFGLSTLVHLGQAIRFRMWWLLPTVVLGGTGEVIGWVGRLWSSKTFLAGAQNPFLMQITSTIIAPTPILAANFVILGRLIGYLGPQYSRLTPKWYTIIFCSADVVALVIQAVGGASASSSDTSNGGNPAVGGHIMLGGIVVQLVAITIYAILGIEYFHRYLTNRPVKGDAYDGKRGILDRKIKLMAFGLFFSTLCIFIRAIYRTIELSDGWTEGVIRVQVFFNVLDGAMIVLAIYTMNFLHPGILMAHINDGNAAQPVKGTPFDSRDDMTLAPTGLSPQAWNNKNSNETRV